MMLGSNDSLSSGTTVYIGSSLPPGVEGQRKGELFIQVQKVEWHVTPNLQSGCSLSINWWGQPPADTLILIIPNGCCPPVITAVYPLVSSMKHVARYFQDMGSLDLSLIVGKQATSKTEPGVSVGRFYLEMSNLSEDFQIQGSHAVFDKTGVLLATVSLKLSILYTFNGAHMKRIDSNDKTPLPKMIPSSEPSEQLAKVDSTLRLYPSQGVSFDDLLAQRLLLLKEENGPEEQLSVLPSAVLKKEEIGRSVTAQVRPHYAETLSKEYDCFGQRKQLVMDFELSPSDRPRDSDQDKLEILPRKQVVMDVELIPKNRTPKDIPSSQAMEQFPERKHLVLDVEVPSTGRGHLLSPNHVEELSRHKQLVMDIDVPTRERGHLSFPFDATSPRIALMEEDLPLDNDSNSGSSLTDQDFVVEASSYGNNTSSRPPIIESTPSSGAPRVTAIKAAGTPGSQDPTPNLYPSTILPHAPAKHKEVRVKTASQSHPLKLPARVNDTPSHRVLPPNVVTQARSKQQAINGETTPLKSRPPGRPRFVGRPQSRHQETRKRSPLSDSKTLLTDEGEHSSSSPSKSRPLSSSGLHQQNVATLEAGSKGLKTSLSRLGPQSRRMQLVMDVETPSGNKGHPGSSFLRQCKQLVMEDSEDHLEGDTGHLSSPTTHQGDSYSSAKPLVPHLKKRSGPCNETRADNPDSSPPKRVQSETSLKGRPSAPGPTLAILTVEEELEFNLKEEARKNCERHRHSPDILPRVPSSAVIPSPAPQNKTNTSCEANKLDDEPGQECDIHLDIEKYPNPAKQLKFHELAGNLAILPGDDSSLHLDDTQQRDIFYAESLERLIERLEAFQQTLQRFSPNAMTVNHSAAAYRPITSCDPRKSFDLSNHLRDVDESISSMSRLLAHLLPKDNIDSDKPKYARVATFHDNKLFEENPDDVGETAHMKELSLRTMKTEEPHKCKDEKPKYLDNMCQVHCDPPKQIAPQDDIFLPLRTLETFNEGLEGRKEMDANTPLQMIDYCEVHGNPQHESEKSPSLNLSLTLTVGKLVFEKSILREMGTSHAPVNFMEMSAFGTSMIESCACLLTISVPGLFGATRKGLEQGISISPVSLRWKEAYFGHQSKLHWSGLRRDTLTLWMSQAMKVTAMLRWDSGISLACDGTISLGKVIELMPKSYQTNLELQKITIQDTNSLYVSEPRAEEDTPVAKIEIGIVLLMEDVPGKPEVGAWLYVSISSVTGCIPQPRKRGGMGHLHLVVKSNTADDHPIPFLFNCDNEEGVKTWRLWKRRQADAVVPALRQVEDATLFIEVWQDWKGQKSARQAASQTFIGLVKVPLKAYKVNSCSLAVEVSRPNEKGCPLPGENNAAVSHAQVGKGMIAAEGDFAIWNPCKDVVCGSLGVRVVLGAEAQMLELQLQNRAARIIQSYVRCFTKRINAGKEECLLFAGKYNRFAEQHFPHDYDGGVTRHVLEVTVLHATDLPTNEAFQGADSAKCEGAFIKYTFPCDREPFYTPDIRWGRTLFFSASVHHGIILLSSQNLETHLMKMNAFSANNGDFLFELWGCFTDDLDKQTYFPNKLRLSDTGESANWDMKREKYTNNEKQSFKGDQRERLLGTSRLLQKNLLQMISEKRRSLYSSPEVRKKFYLPVRINMSQLQTYKRAPTLVVQVAYFILEIEDRKAHMVDTIFSGIHLHEDSLLEATLEVDVLQATGLENAVLAVEANSSTHSSHFETGINSYVRYSLFPSNRQLELIYPPGITSIKANNLAPQYQWTGEVKIILNVQVLKELRRGKMRFEVWHHSYSHDRTKFRPMTPSEESTATDVCLGMATIPTVILLHSNEGK